MKNVEILSNISPSPSPPPPIVRCAPLLPSFTCSIIHTNAHCAPTYPHSHSPPPPTYPHTHAHAQTPHQSSRNGNSIRFMFTGIMLFRRPPYIPCFFNYYLHKGFQWKSNIHEDSFLQKLVVASMGLYFR